MMQPIRALATQNPNRELAADSLKFCGATKTVLSDSTVPEITAVS
ncbi:Uncharacterised protein [Shigella sonnei]|nr:Uncharacterised protein [Shigella sonnei]